MFDIAFSTAVSKNWEMSNGLWNKPFNPKHNFKKEESGILKTRHIIHSFLVFSIYEQSRSIQGLVLTVVEDALIVYEAIDCYGVLILNNTALSRLDAPGVYFQLGLVDPAFI